jgi:endoglucanase Acf2
VEQSAAKNLGRKGIVMKNRNKQLTIMILILAALTVSVLSRLFSLSTFLAAEDAQKQALPSPVVAHALTPIASNQWYSNIYAQFPTEPMYALPAAYQLAPEGLGVSLPDVHKTANTIFAPYVTDLRVGFSDALQKPVIQGIGDWSIQLSMATAEHESLQFTLTHGAPFTVLHVTGSTLQLTCDVTCQVYLDNTQLLAAGTSSSAQVLSLIIRGHTYILSLNTSIPVQLSGNTLTLHGVQRVYLAAPPSRASYSQFKADASAEILGTMATPKIDGSTLYTTYTLETRGSEPLIALYPHQWENLSVPLPVLGSYSTIRGTLKLFQTRTFVTALPLQRPATEFSALRTVPPDLASALTSDIQNYIATGQPGSKDYFLGVWFGKGTDLLQLAHVLGFQNQEQQLLKFMEQAFAQSTGYFHYDMSKKSIIATSPEFGNENLNDHHFHYGYYIRTAAVLVQLDPSYLAQVQKPIDQMVADIGTFNRENVQFPYLRNFDVYEGHSWADGYAKFADGNDQEPTSEAIQAWYGLYLWSQVTHNSTLKTTALYLYTTEITSVREYWFGLNGLYNGDYQHAIASIVWGGKVDFATWFSNDPNDIYGIQLLPFTPGSAYLGKLPDIAPFFADLQAHGGGSSGNWGDLLIMWESYYHPSESLAQKDSVSEASMNSLRSLFLYMLYAHAMQS